MLERIDKLVFHYTIECANCHNCMKVSHVVIEEKAGEIFCSLCGKDVRVPNHEVLVSASKALNDYISDSLNAKYINLVLNEQYQPSEDDIPAH
ncbi:MAG: hypothetical protein Kow0029_14750 [Candidatus Rifleibacteriota bacterium]